MATTGKKSGKKNKGTVISLQSFLSTSEAPAGTTQVAKKIRNVDGDDSDDGSSSQAVVVNLPTAPRANRLFDDNSVPHRPPFIAYITNLPFDVKEDDINDFFSSYQVVSVRLPREDGETGRVRGFGYVEFENRDDLIHALELCDPTIKGRRMRIDLSNENDQNSRQRGNRRGYDNRDSDRDTGGNWRRDNTERNANRDRDYNKSATSIDNTPGSWRMGNRPSPSDMPPRSENSYRSREREPISSRPPPETQERPKLNLKPRTLPLPELKVQEEEVAEVKDEKDEEEEIVNKPTGISAEKVFGSAKPVDTTARDLEIEQRLAEARQREQEKKEAEAINKNMKDLDVDDNPKKEINWREKQDGVDDNRRNQDNRRRNDGGRREYSSKDNRYNRNQDQKSDRSDNNRSMNRVIRNDGGKPKDDNRSKANNKIERQPPTIKNITQKSSEPVVKSSNMYSGLLDDDGSD